MLRIYFAAQSCLSGDILVRTFGCANIFWFIWGFLLVFSKSLWIYLYAFRKKNNKMFLRNYIRYRIYFCSLKFQQTEWKSLLQVTLTTFLLFDLYQLYQTLVGCFTWNYFVKNKLLKRKKQTKIFIWKWRINMNEFIYFELAWMNFLFV